MEDLFGSITPNIRTISDIDTLTSLYVAARVYKFLAAYGPNDALVQEISCYYYCSDLAILRVYDESILCSIDILEEVLLVQALLREESIDHFLINNEHWQSDSDRIYKVISQIKNIKILDELPPDSIEEDIDPPWYKLFFKVL